MNVNIATSTHEITIADIREDLEKVIARIPGMKPHALHGNHVMSRAEFRDMTAKFSADMDAWAARCGVAGTSALDDAGLSKYH